MTRQSNLGDLLSGLHKNTIQVAELSSEDKYDLVSVLIDNVKNSNPRLVLPSLECLQALADTSLATELNLLNKNIIGVCREKLSDSHDNVRQSVLNFLLTMMSPSVGLGTQGVLQQLVGPTLTHKSPKVREEGLKLIKTSFNMFPSEFKISRYIQQIFIMLSDSAAPVRNMATDILIMSYIKFGDKIKTDLLKAQIPEDKRKKLLKDFQNIDSDDTPQIPNNASSQSEQKQHEGLRPMISVEGQPMLFIDNVSNSSLDSEESTKSAPIKPVSNQKRAGGGLTVEDFEQSFLEVNDVYISSETELEKQISKLIARLDVEPEEWESRITALKHLQGTIKTCTPKYPSFPQQLRKLDGSMNDCLRDLRSQVAREACITLAYMSRENGKSIEKSFEYLITPLLTIIQNSTKIISSSADLCLQYCLLNTQTTKVVPLICRQMESKAAIVKKRCAEYILIMLQNWSIPPLKPHELSLSEALKKGLTDGDPNCREFSRMAFPFFNRNFPNSGSKLLSGLSSNLQKTLRELTPESELSPGFGSLLKTRSGIPKMGSRPSSRQGSALSLRSTVSETNLREAEPRTPAREERTPRHKLDIPPTRAMTISGPKPKLRPGLGGLRSSSAMSVDREEGDEGIKNDSFKLRPITGGSMRIKKNSSNAVIPTPVTPSQPRKIQSLANKNKTRTKESTPETGRSNMDGKTDSKNSRRSQSADFLRSKESEKNKSPEPIPLDKLNLPDLVKQIKRQQFADKKTGIEGLHQLINCGEYTLSQDEVMLFKDTLRWLFPESHAKLYVQFLDLLIDFIQVYKLYAEQWVNFILMKLLHRLGTETMSTVRDKINKVLDVIMLNFDKERVFTSLWRILTDATQPLSLKGKQSYCEFLRTLTNHADGTVFMVSADSGRAFEALVKMANDPKPELSRPSKNALSSLFTLNCATFSSLSENMSRTDREMLTTLMRDTSESPPADLEDFSPNANMALGQLLKGYSTESDRRISEPVLLIPSRVRNDNEQLNSRRICLTPVLGGVRKFDTQKMRGSSKFNKPNTSLDSKIRAARSEPASPTDDTLLSSYSLPPASQLRALMLKDPSFENSSLEPELIEESPYSNPIHSAIKEYQMSEVMEDKVSNLILILTIIQTNPDEIWIDNMEVLLRIAMEAMRLYEFPTITITSVRIIREFLKRKIPRIKQYTKELVQFLVDTYPNPKSDIARSCEEIMNHIAGNIHPDITFEMLAPTIAIEQNESLLCAIGKHKILHKVVPDTSQAILNAHLATFCPILIQNYKHPDPAIRKASCFVLVVLYRKLGMKVYEYFKDLTSAQMKLLTLYMSRSVEEMK
ncbi:CLIP-associating protein 1-like isoform X22 [Oopsacas minuta]|uniref:CLIP-associating protein 1-like isoform X22 n=1 Tax=Oopsacas minuta TaxID=111878 RepID=A0AAV7JK79_9METZ|nr:CLIP-associating protein 1-like isoform X22 [Oopsacas minuta]